MTWCNVRIRNAVATSAALGFPIALAGTLGYVYLPALLVISLASVTKAPFGAKTAHSLQVKSLKKKMFAVVLYTLAAHMTCKAFH